MNFSVSALKGIKNKGYTPDKRVATALKFKKVGLVKTVKNPKKLSGFDFKLTKKGENALKIGEKALRTFK